MDALWTKWLPASIAQCLLRLPPAIQQKLEEVRIRQGKPLEIAFEGQTAFVTMSGKLNEGESRWYHPTAEDCQQMLQSISNYSLYALEEELKRGYVTLLGGHRVGLAGRAVLEKGGIKLLRDITSFNVRVARQVFGVADPIIPYLIDPKTLTPLNTLIISPPQCGKTTLLRDIARQLSIGKIGRLGGYKVAIVDERSEIAASYKGMPQFDVGLRTDVLDACPKVEGMMMLIRSMSPELLIVDEIGRPEDGLAIFEALNSGVGVIATAHGRDLADASKRPTLRRLIQEEVFERYVVLSLRKGVGTIEGIYNEKLKDLLPRESLSS
jgi:stage III sporulation protein AA